MINKGWIFKHTFNVCFIRFFSEVDYVSTFGLQILSSEMVWDKSLCLKYGNSTDIARKLLEVKMRKQKESIKKQQTMNKKLTRLKESFNFEP